MGYKLFRLHPYPDETYRIRPCIDLNDKKILIILTHKLKTNIWLKFNTFSWWKRIKFGALFRAKSMMSDLNIFKTFIRNRYKKRPNRNTALGYYKKYLNWTLFAAVRIFFFFFFFFYPPVRALYPEPRTRPYEIRSKKLLSFLFIIFPLLGKIKKNPFQKRKIALILTLFKIKKILNFWQEETCIMKLNKNCPHLKIINKNIKFTFTFT